jgi:hypothetical protein
MEVIDILEDGSFRLTPRSPALSPDEFRFQGFGECFDGGIVVTITLAAHRWTYGIGLQFLLIIVGTILTVAIRMKKAPLRWRAQAYRHLQHPDRQTLLHPVVDGPAHGTPTMQVENGGKVKPAFRRPDIR